MRSRIPQTTGVAGTGRGVTAHRASGPCGAGPVKSAQKQTGRDSMVRSFSFPLLFVSVLLLTILPGCFGGKVPQEEILRITGATFRQEAREVSLTLPDAGLRPPVVAMERLSCFPALDRSAVMVARGNVLTPSTRWYWEGSPKELVTTALAAYLQQEPSLSVLYPHRSRQAVQALLTGRVENFEAVPAEGVVRVRLRLELWTADGVSLLATRYVEAASPMAHLSAQPIAEAASLAMADISASATRWLTEWFSQNGATLRKQ